MFDLATLPTHLRSCQGVSRSPRIDVPDDKDLEDFEPIRVRFRIPGRLSSKHPSRTVVRFPLLLHHNIMLECVTLNRKFQVELWVITDGIFIRPLEKKQYNIVMFMECKSIQQTIDYGSTCKVINVETRL